MKKVMFLCIMIFSLSFLNVYAIERCQESEKHKLYMQIPEEERNQYLEPNYCKISSYGKELEIESVGASTSFPSRYYAGDYGYLTGVRDQRSAGLCWAFAAVGAVETNARKNGVGTYDLSESHLAYSILGGLYKDSAGKENKIDQDEDSGGFSTMAASYFFSGNQFLLENEWPYDDNFPRITFSQYKKGRKILSVKNYYKDHEKEGFTACSNTEINNIKKLVMQEGSVESGIYIDDYFYKDGYLRVNVNELEKNKRGANHAIIIVGWDDNLSFNGTSRKGGFIAKNSWGTTWGKGGYFYISYDDYFICDFIEIFSGVSSKTFDYTYKAAHVYENGQLLFNIKAYFASVFHKESLKNEQLSRVSFASVKGIPYKVYIAPNNDLSKTDEWKLLISGIGSKNGIESYDISSELLVKNTFTIIVEYDNLSDDGLLLGTNCNSGNYKYMNYETGKSFYSGDKTNWEDMAQLKVGSEIWKCAPTIYANTTVIDNSSTVYSTFVRFDKEKIYLVKGNTTTIRASVNPITTTYKTLTWTSSNSIVAEVNQNGEVIAKSAGTATITATTTNGKSAQCTITVYNQPVNPTSISLNITSYSIEVGDYFTLSKTISPENSTNNSVTWTSSDNKVASVMESNGFGRVEALSPGTATITVKTSNGKKATCKVTVIVKKIKPTSITIKNTKENLEIGSSKKLQVIFNPTNTTEKDLTWKSKDDKIAKVDSNGKVKGIKEGTTTITATTSNGKIATCEVTVVKPKGVQYSTHIETYGWETSWKKNGEMSGTSGQAKRLEGIKIKLLNMDYTGNILYRTHIETYGWETSWKKNGKMSGTEGEAKRLEAIEIKLTGDISNYYDVYYRVHAQNVGWMNWAKNGERAGTAGYAYRLEGIEIVLVKKGENPPNRSDMNYQKSFLKKDILYTTHVQNIGWQDYTYDGNMAGTSGQALRLEGIKIKLDDPKYSGNVLYRTHIQNIGWESKFKKNDEMSGTSGQALRLEAIEIKLDGEMAKHYDIYYRVHAENFGWMNWAKNGERAGTAGYAYRLEGIEVLLVEKGKSPPKRANQNQKLPFYEKK